MGRGGFPREKQAFLGHKRQFPQEKQLSILHPTYIDQKGKM